MHNYFAKSLSKFVEDHFDYIRKLRKTSRNFKNIDEIFNHVKQEMQRKYPEICNKYLCNAPVPHQVGILLYYASIDPNYCILV